MAPKKPIKAAPVMVAGMVAVDQRYLKSASLSIFISVVIEAFRKIPSINGPSTKDVVPIAQSRPSDH
jgi:hypothetical protein